jgi:hypothetical protein
MSSDWQRKLKRELKNETLKEFEGWSHNDLVSAIVELRDQNADLEEQLLTKNVAGAEKDQKAALTENMFKEDWSYPTKIHFLLALHQKPLTSKDLDAYLSKLDSHYKDHNTPQYNLSVHLGRAVKSRRIKKIKEPGIKMLYFVLPEWMDNENRLLFTYKHLIQLF